MDIPFTLEQFYAVFRDYNEAVWPAQLLLVFIALASITLALQRRRWSGVSVSVILGFLWAWIAVTYHLSFFTRISPAAYVFSAISMAGAVVFIWRGVIRRRLQFKWMPGMRAYAGVALMIFALLAYPIWSACTAHQGEKT